MVAVVEQLLHLQTKVKTAEYSLGYLYAGQDAFLLDQQLLRSLGVLGDAAQGGVVTIANILGKGEVYQLFFKFVYFIHKICYWLSVIGYQLLVIGYWLPP